MAYIKKFHDPAVGTAVYIYSMPVRGTFATFLLFINKSPYWFEPIAGQYSKARAMRAIYTAAHSMFSLHTELISKTRRSQEEVV